MSERFDQLSARHRQLRLRSEVQRRELAAAVGEVEERLSGVDRGVNAVRSFARHPAVIAGGVAALALIGPRRLLGFASRGAMWVTVGRELLRAGLRKG